MLQAHNVADGKAGRGSRESPDSLTLSFPLLKRRFSGLSAVSRALWSVLRRRVGRQAQRRGLPQVGVEQTDKARRSQGAAPRSLGVAQFYDL